MANFLTINSVPLTVLNGEASIEEPEEIGSGIERAFDGTAILSRQSTKDTWSVKFQHAIATDYLAIRGLVQGLGHVFNFDSHLYSSKGLAPTAGYTAAQSTSGSQKFGAGHLAFSGSKTISYATNLGTRWTVGLWRSVDAGSTWTHYIVDSSGAKYQDGVAGAPSTTFIAVSNGTLTMADTDSRIDDVFAVPYVMPSGWAPYWGALTSAFPSLPQLSIGGDFVNGGVAAKTVIGKMGSTDLTMGVLSGSYRQNIHVSSASFLEV